MKDIELRLVSELLINSCRSDRQLAKSLGVSQPTITRTRARLEKEGYISEYTILPDFNKIGYHLFVLTFFSWKQGIDKSEMEDAIRRAQKKASSVPSNVVLIERGIGLNHDSFMGSFHRDYSSYRQLMDELRKNPHIDLGMMESFIVNLDDEIHYRKLTFSTIARHLLERNTEEKS